MAEIEAFKAIGEFFDELDTQTKKYNKKKLAELVASSEDIFKAVTGEVHVLYFLDTGTVKVTGKYINIFEWTLAISITEWCNCFGQVMPSA